MQTVGKFTMIEPSSGAAGGAAFAKWLWPLAKILGVPVAGLIGALLVAAFDPAEAVPDPKKRRRLLVLQYTTGLIVACFFTLGTVRWMDHNWEWVNLPKVLTTPEDISAWLEVALPVAFLWGGLAIGFIGALVKLRFLISERAAKVIAARLGAGD